MNQKYYMQNLQFGSRPGHYWRTTQRAHVEIFKILADSGYITKIQSEEDFDKDGLLKGLTQTSYRPDLRLSDGSETQELHYATDSDSDLEE